ADQCQSSQTEWFNESVRRTDERERQRGRCRLHWVQAGGVTPFSVHLITFVVMFECLSWWFEALIKNVLEKFPCCVLLRAGLRQHTHTHTHTTYTDSHVYPNMHINTQTTTYTHVHTDIDICARVYRETNTHTQ